VVTEDEGADHLHLPPPPAGRLADGLLQRGGGLVGAVEADDDAATPIGTWSAAPSPEVLRTSATSWRARRSVRPASSSAQASAARHCGDPSTPTSTCGGCRGSGRSRSAVTMPVSSSRRCGTSVARPPQVHCGPTSPGSRAQGPCSWPRSRAPRCRLPAPARPVAAVGGSLGGGPGDLRTRRADAAPSEGGSAPAVPARSRRTR
jgi:hypothetical protein